MEGGSQRGLLWGLLIAVVVLAVGLAGCSGEEAVTVPNVVGMEEIEARDALSDADLELGGVERLAVEADAPEIGTVLSQAPSAGSEIDSGSEVSLVVAEGPEETTDGDEGEAPPAASGGGSGTETKPTAKPTEVIQEAESWRHLSSGSAKGTVGVLGDPFTTNSTALQLTATVRETVDLSGFFWLDLRDVQSGETAARFSVYATSHHEDTSVDHLDVPMSRYQVWIETSPGCEWSYRLEEFRLEGRTLPLPHPRTRCTVAHRALSARVLGVWLQTDHPPPFRIPLPTLQTALVSAQRVYDPSWGWLRARQ